MCFLVLTNEKLVAHKIIKVRPRCYLVIGTSAVCIKACVKTTFFKCLLPLVSLEMLVPAVKIATFFPCGVYRLTKSSVTPCKNCFQYRCIGLVSAKAYLTACKTLEKVFLFLFYLLGSCLWLELERSKGFGTNVAVETDICTLLPRFSFGVS